MRYLAGFLLLAALDTTAHVLFKLTALHAAPLEAGIAWVYRALAQATLYGALGCYLATFFVWISLLRRAPVGPAFAASHLDIVTVMAASAVLLHERISLLQLAGAALILAGIACLTVSETREAQRTS